MATMHELEKRLMRELDEEITQAELKEFAAMQNLSRAWMEEMDHEITLAELPMAKEADPEDNEAIHVAVEAIESSKVGAMVLSENDVTPPQAVMRTKDVVRLDDPLVQDVEYNPTIRRVVPRLYPGAGSQELFMTDELDHRFGPVCRLLPFDESSWTLVCPARLREQVNDLLEEKLTRTLVEISISTDKIGGQLAEKAGGGFLMVDTRGDGLLSQQLGTISGAAVLKVANHIPSTVQNYKDCVAQASRPYRLLLSINAATRPRDALIAKDPQLPPHAPEVLQHLLATNVHRNIAGQMVKPSMRFLLESNEKINAPPGLSAQGPANGREPICATSNSELSSSKATEMKSTSPLVQLPNPSVQEDSSLGTSEAKASMDQAQIVQTNAEKSKAPFELRSVPIPATGVPGAIYHGSDSVGKPGHPTSPHVVSLTQNVSSSASQQTLPRPHHGGIPSPESVGIAADRSTSAPREPKSYYQLKDAARPGVHEAQWTVTPVAHGNQSDSVEASTRKIQGSTGSVSQHSLPLSNSAEPATAGVEARARQQEGLAQYHVHRLKISRLCELEFKGSDISMKFVTGHIWGRHKALIGPVCDQECDCLLRLPSLSSRLVASKIAKDKKWSNPLGLRAGDYPVGFLGAFMDKYTMLLREEYPGDTFERTAERLVLMWDMHRRTFAFGIRCSQDCPCLEGWEAVFKKGQLTGKLGNTACDKTPLLVAVGDGRKRKMAVLMEDGVNENPSPDGVGVGMEAGDPLKVITSPQGPGTQTTERRDASTGGHSLSCVPKKSRLSQPDPFLSHDVTPSAEYTVSFTTSEPLGFYSVDRDGRCLVHSVFPWGAAVKDARIQEGSTIVGAGTSGTFETVSHCDNLRGIYMKHRLNGEDIAIKFRNDRVRTAHMPVQSNLQLQTDDWTASGGWRGKETRGWHGWPSLVSGAQSTGLYPTGRKRSPQENMKPKAPTERGTQPDPPFAGSGSADQAKNPKQRGFHDDSTIVESRVPRTTARAAPQMSNMHQRDRGTALRRVIFSATVETQYFTTGSMSYEFLEAGKLGLSKIGDMKEPKQVIEDVTPSSSSDLTQAFIREPFTACLEVLDDGAASDLQSKQLIDLKDSIKRYCDSAIQDMERNLRDYRKGERVRDFKAKLILMRSYVRADHIARCSRALKYWKCFEVTVDAMEGLLLHSRASAGLGPAMNVRLSMLSGDKLQKIVLPVQPVIVGQSIDVRFRNPQVPPRILSNAKIFDSAVVVFELRSVSRLDDMDPNNGRFLARVAIPHETLESAIATTNNDKLAVVPITFETNAMVESCTLRLKVRRTAVDMETRRQKRADQCKSLDELIGWIKSFNKEYGARPPEQFIGNIPGFDNESGVTAWQKDGLTWNAILPVAGGLTLLHSAVFLDERPLVERLLALGADPNRRSEVGTPLTLALTLRDEMLVRTKTRTDNVDDESTSDVEDMAGSDQEQTRDQENSTAIANTRIRERLKRMSEIVALLKRHA